MPGGRGKIRRKKKGQDKDVSFRFHSGGSLESGAYISEGDRESPVFSDSLDELEEEPKHVSKLQSDNENPSRTDCSIGVGDQDLVRELLESAIDDSDATPLDHPLSDPLFDFDQEPFVHPEFDKRDNPVLNPVKDSSIQTSPTKELEYKETYLVDEQAEQRLADSEGFSDSGDFMNIKDSNPSKVHRLLDSDEEELFFSLTKGTIADETTDDKVTIETDYAVVKNDGIESDNDSIPAAVSPFKDNTSTSDAEDTTVLAEVDTHPLISTGSVEDLDGEAEIKDSLAKDQLLLTEEHFNVPESPKKIYHSPKVKPKRPPPPRPPLPSKMGKPSIVVSSSTSRETGWDNSDGIIVKPEPFVEEAKPTSSAATDDEEKTVQVDEVTKGSDEKSSEIVRDDSLTFPYFVIYTLVIFLYYSLNPSSYLAGFLTGFLFFFITSAVGFIWYVNYLLSLQQKENEAVQKSLELSSQQLIDQFNDKLYFKKINKFGVRFDYDSATHHYSDNTPTHVKLEGFILTLSIKKSSDSEEHSQNSQPEDWVSHHASSEIVKQFDLRDCSVILVPDEIAQNRKRRWSKKFPICVCYKQSHYKNHSFFLFIPTAKSKEMWFRHMKSCSEGISGEEVAAKQNEFYSYMVHYMPNSITGVEKLKPEKRRKKRGDNSSVHYSMKSHEESAEEEGNSAVNITKKSTSVKVGGNKVTSIPPTVPNDMDWLNTALARICWDIWHEKRWYDWVEARIQRRISRIKTPSWMEPLTVTEIQLGKTIPTVKRVYAQPKLNPEGVWIHLAVQYKGSFTMTLETKLRLGKGQKDETDSQQQQQQPHLISSHSPKKPLDRQRKPLSSRQVSSSVDADDIDGNHSSSLGNSNQGQPTFTRKQSLPRSISSTSSSTSQRVKVTDNTGSTNDSVGSDLDSGSDDDMSLSSSLSSSPNISQLDSSEIASITSNASPQAPYPSRPAKWKNMFDRFKNSTIIQKAANTRIVRMAAEKMSSYNLYLTVEVKALDGLLAVNMSPPPSDILWYGFQGKPRLDLSAKPKLGQREVTLHYVTEWIENKLKELLEKQMVLPNMESIAIPILNSGIPGDIPYKLPRLSSTPK